MKYTICIIIVLVFVGNSLFAQHYESSNKEELVTFYIDAIVLSNDPTPRNTINVNTRIANRIFNQNYLLVNDREIVVFTEDGYKAELINISGITIQLKTVFNGKTDFNIKSPGVYIVKVSLRNNTSTFLKTLVQ